jgi:hypothetical protein
MITWPDLDVLEERHAEDGEDEHDQEEQEGDVDEGRKRHHQREEQRPDALRSLDQAQDSPDLGHPHLKYPASVVKQPDSVGSNKMNQSNESLSMNAFSLWGIPFILNTKKPEIHRKSDAMTF